MKIDVLVLGEYETNSYVLRSSEKAADCLIIDTGLDSRPLLEFIDENKLTPAAVILTHGHIDHITGVNDLRDRFPKIEVYIHKLDARLLTDSTSNLSIMAGESFSTDEADHLVDEPQIIEKAGIKLRVIHTPGHTSGGICLYCRDEGVIFVGDTLFAGSVGRTDFPGGDSKGLIENIKTKLLVLPDDTIVYPGHGPKTTIRNEKRNNPFLD
jgi:glyoxylase-like metal-dependent hydrolase (beta-lactamase superfamily II)